MMTGMPQDQHHSSRAPEPAVPASEAPLPQGKRIGARKPLTAGDMTLRNIVWALGLTIAVVVVAAVVVLGIGRDTEQVVPETSQMDVGATAERAATDAPFPVAVPALGEEWTARDARYSATGDPSWQISYSSPSGKLATLTEAQEVTPSMMSSAMPGFAVGEETEISGASCEMLTASSGGGELDRRGIACTGDGWGLMVHGAATEDELTELVTAAIASLD